MTEPDRPDDLDEPHYHSLASRFGAWRDSILSGTAPTLYPAGIGRLGRIEIGPGRVILLGGAPGAGKSSVVLQMVTDALGLTPGLRALVCNVEMTVEAMADRQLARLSGISLTSIQRRRIEPAEHEARDAGFAGLERIADRLYFVEPPYSLANIGAAAVRAGAGLIVIDYVQRLEDEDAYDNPRAAIGAMMSTIRQAADTAGLAFVVISALSRSKDNKGRASYTEGLSMASFRETSELEYGADDVFILVPDVDPASVPPSDPLPVTLRHYKSRNGETRHIPLQFDRPHQRFEDRPDEPDPMADTGPVVVDDKLIALLKADAAKNGENIEEIYF